MTNAEAQSLAPQRESGGASSALSASPLAELAAYTGSVRRLEARNLLFHEGNHRAYLLCLERGWAYAHRTLSDGRKHVSDVYVPGDIIGLAEAWTEAPGPAVTALTEVVAVPVWREDIRALAKRSPDAAARLGTALAEAAQTLSLRTTSLARHTAYERVAYLLWSLRARVQPSDGNDASFTCPMPQTVMADALGLSVVHVNRSLKQLERDGVMRKHTHEVEILDSGALERIARV